MLLLSWKRVLFVCLLQQGNVSHALQLINELLLNGASLLLNSIENWLCELNMAFG